MTRRLSLPRPIIALILMAFVMSACGNPPGSVAPSTRPAGGEPSIGAGPETSAEAQPSGGADPAAEMPPLPADIVSTVDAILDATSDDDRIAATRDLLQSVGVTVGGEENASATSAAGIVLSPEEVEIMAAEAAARDAYRATLADFAQTFGGMSLLPPNDALAVDLADGWLEIEPPAETQTDASVQLELTPLPSHLAAVVSGWVTSAIEQHAAADPELVGLTNAPLLLAELARRRPAPLDLAQPFSARDLRLGWLEITVLTAGMRAMLAGAEAAGVAAEPVSIVLAAQRAPGSSAPMPRGDLTPCETLKQMIDSRVPLVSTHIGSYVGDQIKGFIQQFVNALFDEASTIAKGVGQAFKVLGLIAKVQALVMIYSEASAEVTLDPSIYHKPDGSRRNSGATVEVGIPDAAWEAAKRARELSPFATAMRACARFFGLPVWQDTTDVGNALASWKAEWQLARGGQHVELPARDQFTSGRFERPLTRTSDHTATDAITYDVLPERREDHPGTEQTDTVEFCAHIYPKEPPNGFKDVLSAAGIVYGLATGGYSALVGVIANLLTGWVKTVASIDGCGQATVSFHVAVPGEWRGTITVNTEVQESIESTTSTTDDYFGITTVTTRSERTSVDVTDRFYVGGTEDPPGMGFVSLSGRQYTQGAGTVEEGSATVNDWNNACGEFDTVASRHAGGGWNFDGDATAAISLYPDGTYTLNWSASGYDREVILPGEASSQWTESTAGCPADSDTWDAPMYPLAVISSGGASNVEGHIDPDNPGNRLSGSKTITNWDLSVTTITWNLVHDGPIRLPGGR